MRSTTTAAIFAALCALAAGPTAHAGDPDRRDDDRRADGGELHRNPSGAALTLSSAGRIDRSGPFFASWPRRAGERTRGFVRAGAFLRR